jgi:long-chain-fatty-acid--CoA ligase ACSBG
MVAEKVKMNPDFTVLVCNRNDVNRSWTWKRFGEEIDAFGKACMAMGAAPRSAVNIIGFNSPEWFVAFYGALCTNMVAAGVYTTNASDACQYVAENSEAEIIVVEDKS